MSMSTLSLPQCSGRLLTTLWEALQHYDTLGEAGNAMVSGPASNGKTFDIL